ncbi:response regulator transcription factor [Geofilum rubicundum]|uniref:Phosphate regulon transcriptional regulatory protein PhoB n=1 Tax=Geofilum rubicundum JCM 15548 TaxID=1236989 RepID=A0A0E9LXN5_9BACT|nr:response regulator transcription factor [Geofilum rubicundum]GAO29630.1 phosphate regulon transcriptional regulatory protein PhoB [Geofilum rubicundum JCM 15548]
MNTLIVEDEKELAQEIAEYLRKERFICDVVHTGMEASEMIAVNQYDFLLLDLGLPDYDGLDLVTEAQKEGSEAAIIIITARGAVEDKVKGLNLGADDYLSKPFALVELLSRMQAVARRKFKMETNTIVFGGFEMDVNARVVKFNEVVVDVTRKQFDLLQYLVMNRNRALSRIQLYEHIWGNILDDQYDSNFIDVHIKNLRKKLSEYGPVDWLETVRGVGYKATF